jgi:N-acetylglutamate synthase-like GNAT family acetyltransferase
LKARQVLAEELDEIFIMGYDAWGAGLPIDMYLDSCSASYKYKQGTFYVLEDDIGNLLSSCIVYPLNAFGGVVSEQAVGIGSLATSARERHKGYATLLLGLLMTQLESEGVDSFFIHSEVHPRLYENLGFSCAPEALRNKADGSVPMLRLSGNRKVTPELWREVVMPSHF